METNSWLAEHFEARRPHLQAVAYRMLGSLSEAEDAVQESWLRLSRANTSGVENLDGWLTTVVALHVLIIGGASEGCAWRRDSNTQGSAWLSMNAIRPCSSEARAIGLG